jgi:tRNA-splicing ligase RtcB
MDPSRFERAGEQRWIVRRHGASEPINRRPVPKRCGRDTGERPSRHGIVVCSLSPRVVVEEAPGARRDVALVVFCAERVGFATRAAKLLRLACNEG